MKAGTGFVIKLGDTKFIVSSLNVAICNLETDQKWFADPDKNKGPLILASFGNIDLMTAIEKYMENYNGSFDRAKVEMELKNKFFQVMTTLEINY